MFSKIVKPVAYYFPVDYCDNFEHLGLVTNPLLRCFLSFFADFFQQIDLLPHSHLDDDFG